MEIYVYSLEYEEERNNKFFSKLDLALEYAKTQLKLAMEDGIIPSNMEIKEQNGVHYIYYHFNDTNDCYDFLITINKVPLDKPDYEFPPIYVE